jgi:hypothetical protein
MQIPQREVNQYFDSGEKKDHKKSTEEIIADLEGRLLNVEKVLQEHIRQIAILRSQHGENVQVPFPIDEFQLKHPEID